MIRPALPSEAGSLTALALRSKAYWGYDDQFMQLAASELTILPEAIAGSHMYVLECDGTAIGFYGLRGDPPVMLLEYLFVEPAHIGAGHGRRLWDHALEVARRLGATAVRLDSEPNAEPFYRSRGAVCVGSAPSSIPGRVLPRMEVSTGLSS